MFDMCRKFSRIGPVQAKSGALVSLTLPWNCRKCRTFATNDRRAGVLGGRERILKHHQIYSFWKTTRPTQSVSRVSAKSVEKEGTGELPFGLDKNDELTKKAITTYIPAIIAVLILMYLDAAFSGDWSRVGVITKAQEDILKSFFVISVTIHGLLGIGASAVSLKRGEKSFLSRGLKTFVIGIVAFTEVWFIPEDEL
jgi:hypothetical protein